jgi:predicted aconitase with swiveling domain
MALISRKARPSTRNGSHGSSGAAEPMVLTMAGRAVVAGAAEGTALVTKEPLSLWGGLNAHTGEIIDRRHERSGEMVSGRVFVLPQGRGSSTASAVLLESVKAGKAPAAIINARLDPILALGSIIADELYHKPVPIVVLSQTDFDSIREGDYVIIQPDGTVHIRREKTHLRRSWRLK